MKKIALPLLAIAAVTAGACRSGSHTQTPDAALIEAPAGRLIGSQPPTAIPRAVIYKMIGSASTANVPVLVNRAGEIISYPAPSDLKNGEPIPLEEGYLLDRRGISENSRFTSYTYQEYSALDAPPTVAELRAAIIPDARAVDIRHLSMTPAEALADTAAVNAEIRKF